MSIHKSQGSEFPIVILPMVRQYSRMYARNLLYTALTRAKLKLMLIGEPSAYANCIRAESLDRETTLKQQIIFQFTGKKAETKPQGKTVQLESADIDPNLGSVQKPILTFDNIEKIDPLIGMEGIDPYHFI